MAKLQEGIFQGIRDNNSKKLRTRLGVAKNKFNDRNTIIGNYEQQGGRSAERKVNKHVKKRNKIENKAKVLTRKINNDDAKRNSKARAKEIKTRHKNLKNSITSRKPTAVRGLPKRIADPNSPVPHVS